MTGHDRDRVNNLFAGISRDVTPAPVSHSAHVLYVPVSHDPEVTRHCASVLSDSELQRADRFAAEHDKALFKQRRAFHRFCVATALGSSQPLCETVFEKTDKGRPFLPEAPDIWFSFSSCSLGMLGAWSSTHAVGVDIEDHTKEVEAGELARQYFSATEAEVVGSVDGADRLRTFCRFWTLKEAALKSIGEGLPFGLDTFVFDLKPKLRVVHVPSPLGGSEEF